jgi:tetratricopeptide (TPR) repeat protein
MDAFHKRRFDEAARRFEDLVEKYPDEKEFRDRAKMYLAACRNGTKARAAVPGDAEDLYHVAVFEKNRGNLEKALDLLKKTAGKRDGDGRLHYLAACCHALSGDVDQAITNLKKAIAADDQNRIQARLDTDLAVLRSHQGFAEIVAGGA